MRRAGSRRYRSLLSPRTRRQVVEAGWLEESERLAHISYYRLSAKSTGEDVVVPLRRAT
ncbi:hypothetical protein GCM10010377_55970 [Streptomyces viridiviolaceus]|nr:hypothetical protein GCM10010377_55970 [Streptomyces viridiviolaceus]